MSIKHLSTAHNCSFHGTDPVSQVITFLLKMLMDLYVHKRIVSSQWNWFWVWINPNQFSGTTLSSILLGWV